MKQAGKQSAWILAVLALGTIVWFLIVLRSEAARRTGQNVLGRKEALAGTKSISLKEELRIGTDDIDKEEYIFSLIRDIEADEDGNVYVLDGRDFRIQKYSKEGTFIRTIGKGQGQGPGEFQRPMRMGLGPNGTIYVGDQGQSAVIMFTRDGDFISSIPVETNFADIAVGRDGNFYTTIYSNRGSTAIKHHDLKTGKVLRVFCPNDKELSLSGEAHRLAVDHKGNLFCSHFYPYEIFKYSPEGETPLIFSRNIDFEAPRKNEMGTLSVPSCSLGIAVFPDGKVLNVTRHISGNHKSKRSFSFDIFSNDGQWLLSFSNEQLKSDWIRVAAIGLDGKLYIDFTEPYPHIRRYAIELVDK